MNKTNLLTKLLLLCLCVVGSVSNAWGAASTTTDSKYASGTIDFSTIGTLSANTTYWHNGVKFFSGNSANISANSSAWSEQISIPAYISGKTFGKDKDKGKWGSSGSGKLYTSSGFACSQHAIGVHVNSACTITIVVNKNLQSDTDEAGIAASLDATAYGTAWNGTTYKAAGTALTVTSTRADKDNYPGRYTLTINVTAGNLTDGEAVVKMFNSSSGTGAGKLFCWESITVTPAASTPSISADDIDINYNATSGSIGYSVSNSVDGGKMSAASEADWLSDFTNDTESSEIDFAASANTGAERSATVTLTYTYNSDKTVTKNVTVTQAAKPFSVTYKANGSGEADITDNNATTVAANSFTWSGHRFTGWNKKENGSGASVSVGASVTEDMILFAQWEAVYAISKVIPSNGTIAVDKTEAAAGETVTLTATPSSDYLLDAWDVYKTGESSTKVSVTSNQFTMPAYAVTVNATFKVDNRKKVLYVNSDGNINASDDLYSALNEDYNVTVAAYNASKTVTDFDLVVLHESISGSNANDGLVGAAKTADVPVLNTKSYFYTLSTRWNWGTPNAGQTAQKVATLNTAFSNITSHPIFDGVTISENGVKVLTDDVTTGNTMQPVTSLASGKEGYTLATTPNADSGNGTAIHELTPAQRGVTNAKYLMISVSNAGLNNLTDDGIKLFKNAAAYLIDNSEQWEPLAGSYDITYTTPTNGTYTIKVGDEEAVSESTTATSGETITLSATADDGYGLQAWNVSETESGDKVTVTNNQFTMPAADVTIAATFAPKYTITYNGNGNGSGTAPVDGSSPYISGTKVTVLGNTGSLEKDGYVFCGWNTETDGSGTTYMAGDTFTISANTTLYAVWGMSLTWEVQVGEEETTVTTESTDSYNKTYVAAPSDLALNGLTVTSDPKGTATNKISTTKAKGGYISATFAIQSGKQFIPTHMVLKTTAITEPIIIEVNVGDEVQTWNQPKSGANPDEHTYKFASARAYTGTVTMKIYAYGGKDGTKGYRLGTPITIYGQMGDVPASVTATIASSGWTSLASAYSLNYAEAEAQESVALKAYAISNITKTSVTLTPHDAAPAGVGMILKGNPTSTYTIPVTTSADTFDNELSAAVKATTVAANSVYAVSEGKLKLFTGTTVPAGKAYLLASKVDPEARGLSLNFDEDGETTGIAEISSKKGLLDGDFYDLSGRKVAQPTKGLYIMNGRKVIVK